MLKTIFLILLVILALNLNAASQSAVPDEKGVSQALARWRAANYSNVRYDLDITIEKGAPVLKGSVEIRLSAAKNAEEIILDWRKIKGKEELSTISKVTVNGQAAGLRAGYNLPDVSDNSPIYFEHNEHLFLTGGVIAGENVIKLDFTSPISTSGAAVTRYVDKEDGGEYIYSLFVPSDASTAFPCFDQPDLKARFKFSAIAPKDWKVVSNTTKAFHVISSSPVQTQKDKIERSVREEELAQRGVANFEFEETKPISTYVFAFAAGNFDVFFENNYNGSNVIRMPIDSPPDRNSTGNHIYVRRSQAEKFKQHATEVFRLNREGIKFLESYFDYKYPFSKYDLVLIPEFPFGGMEHAGATFLREDSIIFPQEPTANNYISRANVIFHEAAHQWFGDTVTMRWFDDLWLKEGFAEFMAYKTLEKVMPQYNAWKVFYERNKQAAYLTDSTKGTTPIYQEISNLSAAKSAYGNIVYRKAPSFLKQTEYFLGPDKFQTAVRAFLKKHEFANAGWEDLVREFGATRNIDLRPWASEWVKQRGVAVIRLDRDLVTQKDVLGEGFRWIQKFQVYSFEKSPAPLKSVAGSRDVVISGLEQSAGFSQRADLIFPNYQDYGYGIFLMDDKSKKYVIENIQNEKDDFLRAMMWGSLWDSVREGELDPKAYVELVIKNLGAEKDEVTIAGLLGRVGTAMNYYLPEKQQAELAPRIEDLLIAKILDTAAMGQKLTFYRSFLGLASTEKGRSALKDILKGRFTRRGPRANTTDVSSADVKIRDVKIDEPPTAPAPLGNKLPESQVFIDQIPLKTKDKFDIVTRLLILGDGEAPGLLAELERTENSDEAKRYAYAARAGIATGENKAKYFDDFLNNKNISESWIEAAFGPFNSIRHSDLTLPYLEKALAELPNLKRNRKIFFVNGWLGAFIGGQRGAEALAAVNKFLADNPSLDKDLRLKILENADGLERAVKIRAKFSNN